MLPFDSDFAEVVEAFRLHWPGRPPFKKLCLLDRIDGIELRVASVAPGNPAENVNLPRIREAAESIHGHLHQEVGNGIPEVVDVGLNDYALNVANLLRVLFVEK